MFLRHYDGQVFDNNDPQEKGRVKVKIPELGWDTDDKGAWCCPRQIHSMDVPNVGEWVEVYFIAGDRNRPCYLGQVPEIDGNLPASFTAKTDRVLFEDPDSGDGVIYDAIDKTFKLQAAAIQLNGSSKALVTETLSSLLSAFVTAINAQFATKQDASGSPGSLTLDISTALTTTIKTDG